jgi:hypothetical protein
MDEEESYFILFILKIDSLEKIIDYIIERGGIILKEERIISLRNGNKDWKELFYPIRSPTLNQ